jgi:hypothetical protein
VPKQVGVQQLGFQPGVKRKLLLPMQIEFSKSAALGYVAIPRFEYTSIRNKAGVRCGADSGFGLADFRQKPYR